MILFIQIINCHGAILVLRNAVFLKMDPHPPPRNANNIEPYTFVTFLPENVAPPPPFALCNT